MFQRTPLSLGNASSYLYREPHFPYLKSKARYHFRFGVQGRRTNWVNKDDPEEWKTTFDSRMGIDWYHRHRRRHSYVGWPYISWKNDPIRHHTTQNTSRTLSKTMESSGNSGYPLWDHYEEAGMDYNLPSGAPTSAALQFVLIHVGSTWSHQNVVEFLETIEKQGGFATLEQISANPDALRAWRDTSADGNKVAPGFIEHLVLFCRDVLRNNSKKDFRRLLHSKGYLRTNEMQRYYALPYVKDGTPAMPEKLAQPAGREYQGEHVWMSQNAMKNIHELYTPRGHHRQSFYDA